MVRSIYGNEGRAVFDDVSHRCRNDADLSHMVSRYLTDFERIKTDSDQRDPTGRLSQGQLVSDTGRVYLFLAHDPAGSAEPMASLSEAHSLKPRRSLAAGQAVRYCARDKNRCACHCREVAAGGLYGSRRSRPLCTLWRERRGRAGRTAAVLGPLTRARIAALLPAGAARNALDCALWHLEAKLAGKRAWSWPGIPAPRSDDLLHAQPWRAEQMAAAAAAVPHLKLLKLKLGGEATTRAWRGTGGAAGCPPGCRCQRGLGAEQLARSCAAAAAAARADRAAAARGRRRGARARLRGRSVCADESAHTSADLAALAARYDAVNIKLDKTGGLTEALAMAEAPRRAGSRSWSARWWHLARRGAGTAARQYADWVDLDGPLLLARDREPRSTSRTAGSGRRPELWG